MKYNKFKLGDIVKHNENDAPEFIIVEVLESVPEKKGDYLYACIIYGSEGKADIFKYHEQDLKKL